MGNSSPVDTLFLPGKLPADQLAHLLERHGRADPRLVVGPKPGQDVAVIDMGERYLVVKSDPVTFAADEIGRYVVNVNANDIACSGATPRWFLATLLLPEGKTDARLVESIFAQIAGACDELEVTLAGGHTEITYGLGRPIVVGHMLGEVSHQGLVTTSGMQAGDDIVVTKRIAVEATAIIAREKAEELRDVFDAATLERCREFLERPGISVVRDARVALAAGRVHAMHDPTEGGLATGLWEMAGAAGVGLVVEEAAIPIWPETSALCAHFGLDPLGVIASGSLLIACPAADTPRILQALNGADIPATLIGRAAEAGAGCQLRTAQGTRPLPTFSRDEIARLF
jgi:hydrogenase expression/formation protein HypE